jgi:hypothetical protein
MKTIESLWLSRVGAEVAAVYVGEPHPSVPRPVKELNGFRKVKLNACETRRVSLTLDRRAFGYVRLRKVLELPRTWNCHFPKAGRDKGLDLQSPLAGGQTAAPLLHLHSLIRSEKVVSESC